MRIGINIPNNLYKRLEPLKDRVNVSQICRDAIEEWVSIYERSLEKVNQDETVEIVEKLKTAWKPIIVDWCEIGREDARIWVEKATPEDFAIFAHNLKVGRGHGRVPGIWMAPLLRDTPHYGDRRVEHKEWFDQEWDIDPNSNAYQRANDEYERGWTSYLIAVLNMAKEDKQWIH